MVMDSGGNDDGITFEVLVVGLGSGFELILSPALDNGSKC